MAGMGVERHMFGLHSIYDRFGAELGINQLPAIFNDRGWLKLRHDTLSTTSNPDPTGVVLSGFGPVVDDGFGVCYTIIEDRITITLTSKAINPDLLKRCALPQAGYGCRYTFRKNDECFNYWCSRKPW